MKEIPVPGNSLSQPYNQTNSHLVPIRALRRGAESPEHIAALHSQLVGQSEPMRTLKELIQLVARSEETVLITGESGTGKELVARAVHELSPRRGGPYVAVNCGALAESLLESELFGHVKGAFTGATSSKKGFFEAANGGTLFLDEFAEMSLSTQQRLLRVLQERTVRPIGSTDQQEIKIGTRVVVATNHDLERDVEEGKFRKDLYYRVNVLELNAPPLRDRPEDIYFLAKHFIRKYNNRNGTKVPEAIDPKVMKLLRAYSWPGNVRELENTIKRLAVRTGNQRAFTEEDVKSISAFNRLSLSKHLGCAEPSQQQTISDTGVEVTCCRSRKELVWYQCRLAEAGGNIAEAARQLNIPRTTFRYRMTTLENKCGR